MVKFVTRARKGIQSKTSVPSFMFYNMLSIPYIWAWRQKHSMGQYGSWAVRRDGSAK
jgi:mRNA deadenylase 3'-5' endonuclease subunit Ccr4